MVVSSTVTVVAPDLLGTPDEPGTVVGAQRGDALARDRLARSCRAVAYRFALQLTGDSDDALDLAQDAMLRLFRRLDRLDPARPVRPFLLRIVRNLATDRYRRRRVRPEARAHDMPVAEPRDPRDDPEARASRLQLQRIVWAATAELSAEHQQIVALRDYLDLSYDEIATVLGVPRGTVMSRLHRARRGLAATVRRRLEGGAL